MGECVAEVTATIADRRLTFVNESWFRSVIPDVETSRRRGNSPSLGSTTRCYFSPGPRKNRLKDVFSTAFASTPVPVQEPSGC